METLPQIRQTLSEIDRRIPDALRVAMGVPFRYTPAPAAGVQDEIASFAAACLLQPCPPADAEPMDCDGACDMECDETPRDLRMEAASCYVPDHDEDMSFVHSEGGVVGVADGVGGFRGPGVDAAAFARALMANAFEAVVTAMPSATEVSPYALLEGAYQQAVASRTSGGSTAVILSLVAGKTLKWAYIGDSAFAVFRDDKLLFRSDEQQHYFNCPFQLCVDGGSPVTKATVGDIEVKEGDVVVVGTDGLFDNVFDLELQRIVQMGMVLGFSAKQLADVIAGAAYEASITSNRDTPYSVESRKRCGTSFKCGKPDDITVVVSFIVS
ncbi:hypothetical protein ABZP36_022180 [Zizania latifolia]